MLDGYKAKIAILATFMYAIGGFLTGHLDANAAMALITGCLYGYGVYDKIDRATK